MNGLSFVYYLKMTTRKIEKQNKLIKVVKIFLKDNFCKITYGVLTI